MLRRLTVAILLLSALVFVAAVGARATEMQQGLTQRVTTAPPAPLKQSEADAARKSAGCMSCHITTDSLTMHTSPGVTLGCADCHGGNAGVAIAAGTPPQARSIGARSMRHTSSRTTPRRGIIRRAPNRRAPIRCSTTSRRISSAL